MAELPASIALRPRAVPLGLRLGLRVERVAPVAIVAGLAYVLRSVYGPGAIGYDASYALIWGRELAHGALPTFQTPFAPTPHPLANLVSAPVSLLGDAAPGFMLALSLLSLAAVGWFAYRLGSRLFGHVVGVLFALILLTRPALANMTQLATVDVPFLALVLAAAANAAERPNRSTAVLGPLALAGLLRPEAWLLSGAYVLYLWLRGPRGERVRAAALAAAAPAIWLAFDAAATGDPLYSLHGTQDLAAQLGRPRGLGTAISSLPSYLAIHLGPAVLFAGVGGALLALHVLRRRAAVPAIVAALGILGFLAMAAVGLPVLNRYLLVPSTVLALFCAVGIAGWRGVPESNLMRRAWIAWAAMMVAILAVTALPRELHGVTVERDTATQRHAVEQDLRRLVTAPPGQRALARCDRLAVPEARPLPLVAYWLERSPRSIAIALANDRAGTSFIGYASALDARKLSTVARPRPLPATAPAGLEVVHRTRSWLISQRC